MIGFMDEAMVLREKWPEWEEWCERYDSVVHSVELRAEETDYCEYW
jgi:hypothetical protein